MTFTKRPLLNIEKGIEIPTRQRGGEAWHYPFREMEIGDSFNVPMATTALEAAAQSFKKRRPGWSYTTRANPYGIRIWRIS